jgi:hypothetical protein
MAKSLINLGTSANKGDGDPLRTAFTKINNNFNELYDGNFTDPDAIESTVAPSTDGAYDLGSSSKRWADLYVKDFIFLNGATLEVANGSLLVNGVTPPTTGDLKGSVFADDSTLLVDAVNGIIPGYIKLETLKTQVAASSSFADFQLRISLL